MLLYYFWVMELVKKEMALDFGKVVLLENGILSFVAAANLDTITLSQLEELLAVFVEVTDGKNCLLFLLRLLMVNQRLFIPTTRR